MHARPKYLTCERALKSHMPELLPTYERVLELADGGDQAARFLSLYNPTPYMTGCSQAVWTRGQSVLGPQLRLQRHACGKRRCCIRAWNGQTSDRDERLSVGRPGWHERKWSGRFAGIRRAKGCGIGFGIPLILRYILEFCETVSQSIEVLRSCAQPYGL